MSTTLNLSSSQLSRAAGIRKRIESLEKQLSSLLGSRPESARRPSVKRKARRRKKAGMSDAGRRKLSQALKRRWAKAKSSGKNAL